MAGNVAAAIRRASQAARNAMQQLDVETVRDLVQAYQDTAQQVRELVAAGGDDGGRVRLDQLRNLLAQVEETLQVLSRLRDRLLDDAIARAAQLGVQPLTAAGLAATGREVEAPLGAAQALRVADAAVQFVRAFRAADGLMLSDRLWRIDRGAREALQRHIERGVVQGAGADQLAQDFMLRGQAPPAGTAEAQQAAMVGRLMQGADYLVDQDSGALANVLRVMRTEINRAHGEAYMDGAAAAPGVVGFRFLLSPRHPRPDICDLLARQNLHGLGAGVYPDRKSTPWPAHPNTLSFVVAVFEPEVTDADRAGRETPTEALARLAPELRAGVLGPTKAEYFDRGLLTRGMIRARVGDVRERLTRQGRI